MESCETTDWALFSFEETMIICNLIIHAEVPVPYYIGGALSWLALHLQMVW